MDNVIGHVLDAPVANLCLLSGLMFLAIAVVGNISGKIQLRECKRDGKSAHLETATAGLAVAR